MTTQRVRAAVLALVALLALTGCGRIEKVLAFGATVNGVDRSVVLDAPKKAAKASCAGKLTNDNRLAAPAGLPSPTDTSWLQPRAMPGKRVYLGWIFAPSSRLPDLRNEFVGEGAGRGYTVIADRWSGRVLHVRYSGSADVEISLQPYCRDELAIRYVVISFDAPAPILPSDATAARRVCPNVDGLRKPVAREQLQVAYPAGTRTLQVGFAGNADVYTGIVTGGAATVGPVRDRLLLKLSRSGFLSAPLPVVGDRAQALLGGPRLGSVVVQPWCRGLLAIRYELVRAEDIESPAASSLRPCTGRDMPEQLPENLPDEFAHAGQLVLTERRSASFRSWMTTTRVPGADAAHLAEEVARELLLRGAELTPLSGLEELRAASVRVGQIWALVIVRPQCRDYVAEQYVVTP